MTSQIVAELPFYSADGSFLGYAGYAAALILELTQPQESGPLVPQSLDGRLFEQRIINGEGAVLKTVTGVNRTLGRVAFTLTSDDTRDLLPDAAVAAADLVHVVGEVTSEGLTPLISSTFGLRRVRPGVGAVVLKLEPAEGVVMVRYAGAPPLTMLQELVAAGDLPADATHEDMIVFWQGQVATYGADVMAGLVASSTAELAEYTAGRTVVIGEAGTTQVAAVNEAGAGVTAPGGTIDVREDTALAAIDAEASALMADLAAVSPGHYFDSKALGDAAALATGTPFVVPVTGGFQVYKVSGPGTSVAQGTPWSNKATLDAALATVISKVASLPGPSSLVLENGMSRLEVESGAELVVTPDEIQHPEMATLRANLPTALPGPNGLSVFSGGDLIFQAPDGLAMTPQEAAVANPLASMKWAALGTSITDQEYYTSALVSISGMVLTNLGVSGGSIASGSHYGSLDIYDAVASIPSDTEVVTIEAGINDFGTSNSDLGVLGDTTTATFYGALYAAVVAILAQAPAAKIVFLTPFSGGSGVATHRIGVTNSKGLKLQQFQKAVEEVAAYTGYPCIDVGRAAGIGYFTAATLTSDGLHLNTAGGEAYAAFVFAGLLRLADAGFFD